MREYKNSEMFALLEKDSKLAFACVDMGKKITVSVSTEGNYFVQEAELDGQRYSRYDLPNGLKFFGNVSINSKWQLVRTPVTWQEAIQASLDGNRIKCECKLCDWSCIKTPADDTFCMKGIRNGTWYIEGETDAV